MPFAYYRRLNARQKRIYDRSDAVSKLELPRPAALRASVDAIATALADADRVRTERAAGHFTEKLLQALRVSLVDVKVLAKRPSNRWGELHGLYEPSDGKSRPLLTVWMRTAQRKDVVAFKSFLRTLLHEIGHHLDYELLGLEDSFHTQGFYRRESSLFHQLVPDPRVYDGKQGRSTASGGRTARKESKATRKKAAAPSAARSTASRAARTKRHDVDEGATAPAARAPEKKREPVQGSLFD